MNKKEPLVSVIVPTYNSSKFLDQCLQSIINQSYTNIELIVVDNNSTDNTKIIAQKYTKLVFNKGPERSAQVNYGVTKSSGEYVYKVDSDFVLDPKVVQECIAKVNEGFEAIVVHNTPDETISWIAKVRKFEVDMYKYDLSHSSARFVSRKLYDKIGGFNSKITSAEDYDFQNKINNFGIKTGFIEAEALHLGEPTHFWPHMKKYFEYGRDMVNYHSENSTNSKSNFLSALIQALKLQEIYFLNWKRFIFNPIIAVIFVLYNLCKYIFGGLGFVSGKIRVS
jgi:glycosyltransferase involved in cell wall biosynthesis